MKQHKSEASEPKFLRRLQELASILELREAFDNAPHCEARIRYPTQPGQITGREEHSGVLIEAWSTEPAAAATRLYQYTQFYPQKNEFNEIEAIKSLICTCDQSGKVCELKIAKQRADMVLLHQLENIFANDPAIRQSYADEWVAESIETFGYLEAARATRRGTTSLITNAEDLEKNGNDLREQLQDMLFQHIQQETGQAEI
jgi:hypothetical protein